MERLSIGLWKSRWAFDRFYAKYQYEGTEQWETPYRILNKIVDVGDLKSMGANVGTKTIRPCDLVVEQPVTVHVIYKNYVPVIEEPEALLDFSNLTPNETKAGCCELCRISGTTANYMGKHMASAMMFVLGRDGKKLKRYGREIVGAWSPCITPSHTETKKQVDVL